MTPRPSEGELVDGFRVERLLHASGMASIHRVRREAGRPAARDEGAADWHGAPAASVVCYETEEAVLGALSGPHVPRLVAVGDLARQP